MAESTKTKTAPAQTFKNPQNLKVLGAALKLIHNRRDGFETRPGFF